MSGIELAYSYRVLALPGISTDKNRLSMHMGYINLIGDIQNSSRNSFFGGMGLVIGFAAKDNFSLLNRDKEYYADYSRLIRMNNRKQDFNAIGADVRNIIYLPFSFSKSISSSYFYYSLEVLYIKSEYIAESGGLGKYSSMKKEEKGVLLSVNTGIKVLVFDVYGGIGWLSNFYSKGITFKLLEGVDRKIDNQPKQNKHFAAYLGLGLTFDMHLLKR